MVMENLRTRALTYNCDARGVGAICKWTEGKSGLVRIF